MSASVCASCLSRLRISTTTTSKLPTWVLPITASFSTSSIQQKNPTMKKQNAPVQGKFREARSARIKKKTRERPKPPAPGERRTQKKRIVLSNVNALEVAGLKELSPETMADAEQLGHMLTLNGPLLDQLRESKSFKTTQNWNMFRQPSTLMRQETLELGQDIKDVIASQQDQGFGAISIQKIVTGERGAGKSIHLVQAQSMAFLNGWVVITIPECQDFVINTSAYTPASSEESQSDASAQAPQQLYHQPQLASQLLSRIAHSNTKVLQSLKLIHQHGKSLPFKPTKATTLFTLAEAGINDPTIAIAVFSALWKELTQPAASTNDKNAQRPPVLVTLDGIDHWMGPTLYHSSDHKLIHAHQFTMVQHFLSLLFPQSDKAAALPSGGMVLAATTGSNSPEHPSFKLLLQQLGALQAGQKMTDRDFPMPSPYTKSDQSVLDLIKNSQATGVTAMKGLTRAESKNLLEYFARSGILRERVTEVFVGEKWSLSAGGVIGELAKFGKRIRA